MQGSVDFVKKAIEDFFAAATHPVLFTGAGASMQAGLPDWKGLLNRAAEAIKAKDPATAFQMQTYVAKGSLTRAADYFWITDEVLDVDKHSILKTVLKEYDSKSLLPLASLPFEGVITTNFDRSLNDAIAVSRGRVPIDYVFGDPRYIQATFERELFVARIHGAVESPASLILSETQFKSILENDVYLDVLSENFLHRSVLFLGFSFYDPAIKFVFERLEKKFGRALPGRHVALLPDDNSSELVAKAARLNIQVVKYDSANRHAALWSGIEQFSKAAVTKPPRLLGNSAHPYASAKQYLAACFARASVDASGLSLREMVVEGIVSAILQGAYPKGVHIKDLYDGVRKAVGVKGSEIEGQIDEGLKALVEDGLVRKHRNPEGKGVKYAWTDSPDAESTLDKAIDTLKQGVANRAYATLGWRPSVAVLDVVNSVLREIVHRRGWDLGAAFAAGKSPDIVVYRPLIHELGTSLPTFDRQRLEQILEGVFLTPTDEESRLLGELGRVSFALELAFQAPRTTLFHRNVLPRRIYFDTNFLMPAVVEGHPHNLTYKRSLDRLSDATRKAGGSVQLILCRGYLNEIISHRRIAFDYREEAKEDFEVVLRSDVMYHGPGNINVFLGGYANSKHNGFAADFESYMERVAPYTSEAELRRWLDAKGILVVEEVAANPFSEIYGVLEKSNAGKIAKTEGGKNPIVIKHDALQLTLLERDRAKSERALFVTADRKLFEDIEASKFSALCEFMVSNVGLIQLIDVLVGLGEGDRGLGDLLWSSRLSEKNGQIRSYLVMEALSKYETGLSLRLHDVVEQQSEAVERELKRLGQSLDSPEPRARVQAFRSLTTLENDFFSKLKK